MTGWVARAWPATAVADGWVAITSRPAAAGLIAIGSVTAVRPPPPSWSLMLPAMLSARPVKAAATPPETVARAVPWRRGRFHWRESP